MSWPAPMNATRPCSRRTAPSTSGTRSRSPCGWSGRRAAARAAIQARFRYVLVDEFQDTNRAQSELVSHPCRAATATSPSSGTTTSRSTASAARRSATSWASGSAIGPPGRSSSGGTTARGRRSSRPPIASSSSTIRTGSRSRPGSASSLVAERGTDPAGRTVRLETHPSGHDEADRIAAEIGGRIAGGTAPRDIAILVRANGHADPILRSLDAAGVPWRFSGTSGLYARPEVRRLLAFLRAIADLGSSVDLYALATERAVPPRRRGPDRDRQRRAAPQSDPLGCPRGARPAARTAPARRSDA